jgi:hypothetical protein
MFPVIDNVYSYEIKFMDYQCIFIVLDAFANGKMKESTVG